MSIGEQHMALFRKLLPQQVKLHEISRLLGNLEGKQCLDAGFDSAVISEHLRKQGGSWNTIVRHDKAGAEVLEAVGNNVQVYDGYSMPFDDKTFDVVILSDFLERVSDDSALITECHRILKATGNLIVNVPHTKRWSITRLLESLLGPFPEKKDWVRTGYTEAELFQLLKHGFDVRVMRSYSKTFVELVSVVARFKSRRIGSGENSRHDLIRLYSRLYPFYWIAFQLDCLLFLTKGHNLVAVSLRHPWRPRTAPVLNDGRSITEAVLSKIRD